MTGGGFYDEEVGPGFYYVVARTTVSPVANMPAARSMWHERATKKCKGNYEELEVLEYVDEPAAPALPGLRYLIATRRGYALCETSPLTPETATQSLDDGARIVPKSDVQER